MEANTAKRIARELTEQGHAVFTDHISHFFPPLIEGFQKLIADPDREKWSLNTLRVGSDPREPDDGLIRKEKGLYGKAQDNKWFFHYRRSLEDRLQEHGVDTTMHTFFLDRARELHLHCHHMMKAIGLALDGLHPDLEFARHLTEAEDADLNVLRLLSYDKGSDIGKAHTDLSALTFHLAESRPGLRIGSEPRQPYKAEPNKILVFNSIKIQRLSKGRLPAVPHDIVDDDIAATEGRWSVVYFAHFPGLDRD